MHSQTKQRSKWLWVVSLGAVLSLTGCAIYPSKPGDWPHGSWAWWGHVLQFVSKIMDFFAHHLGGSYALALLALTIIVRIIVLPFFIKQMKHTRVMQQLQPEIQKIRSKYKGDNQKIQAETMKLWQEHGANPMAGCFPMVIQLPVLYALFGAIEGNAGLNHSSFLWIPSLAQHDPYFILPILAGITTYFSSRVMMTGNDSQQKMMLYIMPVFIVLIGSRMASGLALYWTYSNIFTAVQGYFVKVRPLQTASATAAQVVASEPEKPKASSEKNVSQNSAKAAPRKGRSSKEFQEAQAKRKAQNQGQSKSGAGKKQGSSSNKKK